MLRLNLFEEFELWLESLVAYCGCAGQHLGKSEPDKEGNFRGELTAVAEVLGQLQELCPKIIEPETGKVSADHDSPFTDLEKTGRQGLIQQYGDFFQFWEYLQRARLVGVSMCRHASLSLPEYRAYASLLSDQIAKYRSTEAHELLTRKYLFLKYQHLIQRDLVSSIEVDGVREELSRIFFEFLRILSYLDYFQNSIRRSFKYQRLIILLHFFQHSYRKLLKILEQSHRYLGYSLPHLSQEVTSVRFALKMEVKRIFKSELKDLEAQQKLGEIYSRMETALGLLVHLTQQSFMGLVRQLNPAFDEKSLFSELRDQQAEALRLVGDLNKLYKLTVKASGERDDAMFKQVVDAMDRFQEGSMRLLFFKYLEPIEEFGKELHQVDGEQQAFVLHRLEVFLSTLIGEVSKRAVLSTVNRAVGS